MSGLLLLVVIEYCDGRKIFEMFAKDGSSVMPGLLLLLVTEDCGVSVSPDTMV